MMHSINEIATRYSSLSDKRQDKKRFNKEDFILFATKNHKKYSLTKNGTDYMVSTWYTNDLIDDYRKTL